jgi:hypothetical protein
MNGPLFESSNLLSLFSTPVWELQLPARLYEPINAAVLAVVDDVRAGDSPPAPGTARQSRPDLHLRPELGDWSIASTKLRSEYCAFSRSPTAASGSPAAGPTSTPRAQPTGCTVTPTVTSAESITCALRPERTASICTTRACRPGLSVPPRHGSYGPEHGHGGDPGAGRPPAGLSLLAAAFGQHQCGRGRAGERQLQCHVHRLDRDHERAIVVNAWLLRGMRRQAQDHERTRLTRGAAAGRPFVSRRRPR